MNIDKCPYCNGKMESGKLYYINNLRTPKLVLESDKKIKINKWSFNNHIKNVYYCEKCKIYIGNVL